MGDRFIHFSVSKTRILHAIFTWTPAEKRLERALFDRAVQAELAELIADFKQQAAAVQTLAEMWALGDSLNEIQQDFQFKYDYRYSLLPMIFGRLVREGRIKEEELEGLSAEKREYIHRFVTL